MATKTPTGLVYTDGDGVADFSIALQGVTSLAATDFIL